MIIEKNKRKCKCWLCSSMITTKYKARWNDSTYHLKCLYNYLKDRIESWRKEKRQLSRYKKYMVLESLDNENK